LSVDVDAGLGSQEGSPSWEELGHRMYDKSKVRYHTQIDNPDAMSFLDQTSNMVGRFISAKAGTMMRSYLSDYRDNMVAYNRQRATETVSMVKANMEAEKSRANMKEMLLGLQR
jgi:hypothetical protein